MNNDQYKITVAFIGRANVPTQDFRQQLQAMYDGRQSPAGSFEIVGTTGADKIVEFTRELGDDMDYALAFCPDDLNEGLCLQLTTELLAADCQAAFTIIGKPVHGNEDAPETEVDTGLRDFLTHVSEYTDEELNRMLRFDKLDMRGPRAVKVRRLATFMHRSCLQGEAERAAKGIG